MIGRVPRCFLMVGIVTAASACDNVAWGGFHMHLQAPSQDTAVAPAPGEESPLDPDAEVALPPTLPLGPLLYAGARVGDSAWLVPVAEVGSGGLHPLPATVSGGDLTERVLSTRLRPGQELTLFSEGSRVGTLVVGEGGPAPDHCAPRPRARGHLELVPGASEATRFLAVEKSLGRTVPVEPFRPLRDRYEQRVGSLDLATTAVPRMGAPWPPSLLEIRSHLKILALEGAPGPAVLATFLYEDRMQVAPAPANAYALMVLGEPIPSPSDEAAFELVYAWYRPVGEEGKGAPRYAGHMDWDGDGEDEILLEVLGGESRWFAALDRTPQGWALSFQDPCGAPPGGGGE